MATHSSILAWRIPVDGGAWLAIVHGVAKNRTRLSDFTFTFSHSLSLAPMGAASARDPPGRAARRPRAEHPLFPDTGKGRQRPHR